MTPEDEGTPLSGPPWPIIAICMAFGLIMIGLGNMDRVIWDWTSHGEKVSGRVLDVSSFRSSRDATYLTYVPRVSFTDPGGQAREMSVGNGSRYYNFRNGDRVTVLWRGETQTIAIDLPFKRAFSMSILLWGLTILGLAMIGLAVYFWIEGLRARRRAKRY